MGPHGRAGLQRHLHRGVALSAHFLLLPHRHLHPEEERQVSRLPTSCVATAASSRGGAVSESVADELCRVRGFFQQVLSFMYSTGIIHESKHVGAQSAAIVA